MKRLQDNSDAPKARHGILLKHLQAQRKGQDYILFVLGRMSISVCCFSLVNVRGATLHLPKQMCKVERGHTFTFDRCGHAEGTCPLCANCISLMHWCRLGCSWAVAPRHMLPLAIAWCCMTHRRQQVGVLCSSSVTFFFIPTFNHRCVKLPRLRGRRSFTQQPQNSKRAHFEGSGASDTTKIPREDTQRDNKSENGDGKKKREILGLPPFVVPPFVARFFLGLGPTLWGSTMTHTRSRNRLAKHGLAKIGLAKIGQINTSSRHARSRSL